MKVNLFLSRVFRRRHGDQIKKEIFSNLKYKQYAGRVLQAHQSCERNTAME